jgi:hypothetical protein
LVKNFLQLAKRLFDGGDLGTDDFAAFVVHKNP